MFSSDVSHFKMNRIITGHIVNDHKLVKPFRIIVGGGSGAGKTQIVKQIVDNNFFDSPFDKIIYNYPHYLNDVDVEFNRYVEFRSGLVNQHSISLMENNTLLIIDDLSLEAAENKDIANLFAVEARKRNISIILITQNIYQPGKMFRNIRINATGFILFKFYSATDINKRLLRDVGLSDIVPNDLLRRIYSDRFKYIMIDLHPNRHSHFGCVSGNIFSGNPEIYHKMKFIAIKESDFYKYFKVLDSKSGRLQDVKNENKVSEKGKRAKKRKTREKSSASSSDESESE